MIACSQTAGIAAGWKRRSLARVGPGAMSGPGSGGVRPLGGGTMGTGGQRCATLRFPHGTQTMVRRVKRKTGIAQGVVQQSPIRAGIISRGNRGSSRVYRVSRAVADTAALFPDESGEGVGQHNHSNVNHNGNGADVNTNGNGRDEHWGNAHAQCCGHDHAPGVPDDMNAAERLLSDVLRVAGVMRLCEALEGSLVALGAAWTLLIVAGVCSVLTVNPTVGTAATAGVFALLGPPELKHVLFELARKRVTIHLLTTCAVFGTIWLGCAVEGALLLALFETATVLEQKLTAGAQGDLRNLWATVPKTAKRVLLQADGSPDLTSLETVPAKDMVVGSYALVRAGEQVPLDGELVYGTALVSVAHITGESLPLPKKIGDEIPAGAAVTEGVLVIRTTADMEDSTPARIARLTAAAQQRKPKLTSFFDSISEPYSQVVLALTVLCTAGLVATGHPLMGPGGAAYRAFGFLAAAAPCAMLMTPLAYVAAIAACAQRGVLVRGGRTLDMLDGVRIVALDKTGTLTTGIMQCVAVEGVEETNEYNPALFKPERQVAALATATALERFAVHPIARAVVQAGEAAGVPRVKVEDFRTFQGQGVQGTATPAGGGDPMTVRFGTPEFACALAADAEGLAAKLARVQQARQSSTQNNIVAALVCTDAREGHAGEVVDVKLFRFADSLRGRTVSAVRSLTKDCDLHVVMLTGDNAHAASSVAAELSLSPSQVRADMKPEDKMHVVRELQMAASKAAAGKPRAREGVMMVGDGVNDAPALAEADVGVAIVSTPSEASAAAADILLLHKDSAGLSMLPFVLRIARATRTVVVQNLALASVSVGFTAAAALAGAVPLWLTVLLHEGTTVIVALNSIRLLFPDTSSESLVRVGCVALAALILLTPIDVWVSQAWAGLAAGAGAAAAPANSAAPLSVAGQRWLGMVAGARTVARLPLELAVTVVGALQAALASWAAALGVAVNAASSQAVRSAGAGLLAGVLHTLTGPDHLAALAPLTIGRSRAQSTLLGGLWGCGHNTGQILFGMIFLVLRDRLSMNMDLISQWGQGIVGVTLILIGMLGFKEAMELNEEEGEEGEESIDAEKQYEGKFSLGTYFTGLIHGLQPDALLVLLPALALPSGAAAAYLGTFLMGTVVAMASYTFFLGVSSSALAKLRGGADTIKKVSGAAALVAFGVGLSLLLSAAFNIDILPDFGGH